MVLFATAFAAPPFYGSIFIDQNIIPSNSPTSFVSSTYVGQEARRVYDRRNGWVDLNTFVYAIVWDDGLTTEALINPEFSHDEAAVEAEFYGIEVGRLPTCLRVDVDFLWIHKGVNPFGGGNRSLTIHTGQSDDYISDGILEETLMHEASHTSLDEYHAASAGWLAAQTADNDFITTYAQDNPTREDVGETFLLWYAARYRSEVISTSNYTSITETVPNRLAYFDTLACDLYPLEQKSSSSTLESSVVSSSDAGSSSELSSSESSSSLLNETESSSELDPLSSSISSSSAAVVFSSEEGYSSSDVNESSGAEGGETSLIVHSNTLCQQQQCEISLYSVTGALLKKYSIPQGMRLVSNVQSTLSVSIIKTDSGVQGAIVR